MQNCCPLQADDNDGVETVIIGQSYEGRDMTVLQINRAGDDAPTVWVEAGKRKRCLQTAVKIAVQLFSKEQ